MKKSNIFLVTLMALIVMSCSKDETTMGIPQEGNAIEFGTYVGRDAQTRATMINDLAALKSTGFGVFAYYTGQVGFGTQTTPNFMNNQKVEWDATLNSNVGAWKYAPVKYWPNNVEDKVSFFAYAPYNLGGTVAPTFSGSTLDFTVKNTVTEQIDLLWNSTKATDLSKQDVEGKVAFNFKHALSRIGINVKAVVDEVTAGTSAKPLAEGTTITVKKIVLCKSATIDYTSAPGATTFSPAFYTGGKLNLNIYDTDVAIAGSAAWSDKSGTQSFTLLPANFMDASATEALIFNSGNSTVFQPNNADSYIMIIPQDFTGEGENFTVYIEYEVTTTDTDTTNGAANSSTITNKIATPVKINFESGKAYALNLQLGMTSVKLDATVTGWINATDTDVDVPINTTTP